MTDNVIKGPWKRTVNVTPEENDKDREQIAVIEEVAEQIVVNAITIFSENGFDVDSTHMRKYIPFINECIRAVSYKEFGHDHLLNKLIDDIMVQKKVDNNLDDVYYSVGLEKLKEMTED